MIEMTFSNVLPSIKNVCDQVKCELAGLYTEAGTVDLVKAAAVIKKYTDELIPLKNLKSYSLRVCGQDGTVYTGNEDQLEAWKDFYLPERMEMEVIGAVDDFPCDAFGQLVLLMCEDGKIYAYEDELLHLVARNVVELFETGLTFPGLECYKLGECFEDYTEEEYNQVMESDDVKEMIQEHEKFRESWELKLLESINLESKYSQIKGVEESSVQPTKASDCKDVVIRRPMQIALWGITTSSWSHQYEVGVQSKQSKDTMHIQTHTHSQILSVTASSKRACPVLTK